MTERHQTKKILINEFLGTALAIGAGLGAAAYATKKFRDAKSEPFGFWKRMRTRVLSQVPNSLATSAREKLLQQSDQRHAEAHAEVAQKYGISLPKYAGLLQQHQMTERIRQAHDIITAGGGNPDAYHLDDVEDIIKHSKTAAPGSRLPASKATGGIAAQDRIGENARIQTGLEIQDLINPQAKRFREKITKQLAPQMPARQMLQQKIDAAPSYTAAIEADKQAQKQALTASRNALPNTSPKKLFRHMTDWMRTTI